MRKLKSLLIVFWFIPFASLSQRIDNTVSFRNINADRYFRITYDNDYFTATDRYYTQGINLELVHPVFNKNPLSRLLVRSKGSRVKNGLAIEHSGFTPTSIRHSEIIEKDRPFAATLLLKSFRISSNDNSKSRWSSTISLGMIGPIAFGEGMQKSIHRWIGDIQPLGWQHQIQNDIAINYELNHEKQILYSRFFSWNTNAQIILGTLNDRVLGGFTFTLGKYNSPYQTKEGRSKSNFQLYFFNQSLLGINAYDATLQGGMFNRQSSYTIGFSQLEKVTFRDNFGAVLTFRKIYLEYFRSVLTKEYKTGNLHWWGGIKVGLVI